MDYKGQQINQYRMMEKLGQGGMAVVYQAFDARLERDVAIKIVRKEAIPPENLVRILKRFEREAKALAKFVHPHIVPVFDYGDYDGAPYLVMAYLRGGTLKERIGQPVAVQQALRWALPMADALGYAHARGVIHRDVKPGNILITEEGVLMLSDFGIAQMLEESTTQLTATGMGVGTPEYMAPEQWKGQTCEASDQYALGVVLYELLTGQKPYSAETPLAVALKQMSEPLRRPAELVAGVPESVEKVLYKALARQPEERYADMAAFGAALEKVLGEMVTGEHPAPVVQAGVAAQQAAAVVAGSEDETRDELAMAEPVKTAHQPAATGKAAARKTGKKVSRFAIKSFFKKMPRWVFWAGGGLLLVIVAGIILREAMGLNVFWWSWIRVRRLFINPIAAVTTESKVNEKDGAVMVWVPAGEFAMGSWNGDDDEAPVHSVYLDAYWIYQTEVTNGQYRQCIEADSCEGYLSDYPDNQYPAVYIEWYEARDYCAWAGGRLPTEAEWEKAARGTDGQTYPWGNAAPSCNLANYWGCTGGTQPVGSFPAGASPYGVLDMAGNVWEWVSDWYSDSYYSGSATNNPTGPASGTHKVVRGGSWLYYEWGLRASYRFRGSPVSTDGSYGFRCLTSE